MNCPRCPAAPLEEKEFDRGIILDFCPVCDGAWFGAGELGKEGARIPGFDGMYERARKTLQPAAHACPGCTQPLGRAWIAELGVEFFVCASCGGDWLDHDPLWILKDHFARKFSPDEPAPEEAPLFDRSRVVMIAVAFAAIFLLSRPFVARKSAKAAAPPPPKTAADYEREGLAHQTRAEAAQARGKWSDAEEDYYAAAGFFNAGMLAAGPDDFWRLAVEYAQAGEPLARIALRDKRFAEAENIQNVRLDIYTRREDPAGQAAAWRGLAEIASADGRSAEAAKRFKKAASLYRRAGDAASADGCLSLAARP